MLWVKTLTRNHPDRMFARSYTSLWVKIKHLLCMAAT